LTQRTRRGTASHTSPCRGAHPSSSLPASPPRHRGSVLSVTPVVTPPVASSVTGWQSALTTQMTTAGSSPWTAHLVPLERGPPPRGLLERGLLVRSGGNFTPSLGCVSRPLRPPPPQSCPHPPAQEAGTPPAPGPPCPPPPRGTTLGGPLPLEGGTTLGGPLPLEGGTHGA